MVICLIFMANSTCALGVSGDGIWMKGSHASKFVIVCYSCETMIYKLHKSRHSFEEFDESFQENKNSKQCQINYEGSSGSIDRAALLILTTGDRADYCNMSNIMT